MEWFSNIFHFIIPAPDPNDPTESLLKNIKFSVFMSDSSVLEGKIMLFLVLLCLPRQYASLHGPGIPILYLARETIEWIMNLKTK